MNRGWRVVSMCQWVWLVRSGIFCSRLIGRRFGRNRDIYYFGGSTVVRKKVCSVFVPVWFFWNPSRKVIENGLTWTDILEQLGKAKAYTSFYHGSYPFTYGWWAFCNTVILNERAIAVCTLIHRERGRPMVRRKLSSNSWSFSLIKFVRGTWRKLVAICWVLLANLANGVSGRRLYWGSRCCKMLITHT